MVHDTEVAGAQPAVDRYCRRWRWGCSGSRARCSVPTARSRRSFRPERGCRRRPRCAPPHPSAYRRCSAGWSRRGMAVRSWPGELPPSFRRPQAEVRPMSPPSAGPWRSTGGTAASDEAQPVARGGVSSASARSRTIWWMVGAAVYQVASTVSMSSQNVLAENRPLAGRRIRPPLARGRAGPRRGHARGTTASPRRSRRRARVDKPPRFR